VDVSVVDRDGNPVHGLKAEDFALFDRKKPQAIAAFTEVSHPRAAAAPPVPAFAASVRRDVSTNRIADSDRLVVVVVDDLHIYRARTNRSRDLAREVIARLGPPASMAILFTSGEHSTLVTQDPAELYAAVESLEGRRAIAVPAQAIDKQVPGHIDSDDPAEISRIVGQYGLYDLGDFFDNMSQFRTLQDAARLLGPEDARRKAFVLISEGIGKDLTAMFDGGVGQPTPCDTGLEHPRPAGDMPDPNRCYHDIALRQMMHSLARASVVTYAIDPRGRVGPGDLAREGFPDLLHPGLGDDPGLGFRWMSPVRAAQDGLSIMTEASGGFAVTNTDDFSSGLKRIVDDIGNYYLLGFSPQDPTGKGYRALAVEVPGHPEWTVHARNSYEPLPPVQPSSKADALTTLVTTAVPHADLPLRAFATALPGPGRDARVSVTLEITEPAADLLSADGRIEDDLSYAVFGVEVKHSKVTQEVRNTMTITAPRAPGGGAVVFQTAVALTLAPGHYQLRASATSAKLAKGGSVYLMLDVPDFSKAPLSLTGIVLGYANGPRVSVARVGGKNPAAQASLPFDPCLDREFLSQDTLRAYAELAHADRNAVVQVSAGIVDTADRVVLSLPLADAAVRTGRIDTLVPLASLAPGDYRLRLTASAGETTVTREIAFIVRPPRGGPR
jgi:VWFA-related protein